MWSRSGRSIRCIRSTSAIRARRASLASSSSRLLVVSAPSGQRRAARDRPRRRCGKRARRQPARAVRRERPERARLLARTSLGGGSYSQALYDHHAFLYWPPTKLAVLPVQIYPPAVVGPPAPATGAKRSAFGAPTSSPEQFVGAIGLQLTASGIVELGRIVHDPIDGYSPPILRSIVISKTLFTLSDGGVMASSVNTLARQAFAAFPQQSTAHGRGDRRSEASALSRSAGRWTPSLSVRSHVSSARTECSPDSSGRSGARRRCVERRFTHGTRA